MKKGRTEVVEYNADPDRQTDKNAVPRLYGRYYGEDRLVFSHATDIDDFEKIFNQYVLTDHCDIFLEEPENNLFPPTQAGLANWIIDLANGEHANSFFIATHSPYVLGELLKNKTPMGLFFIYEKEGSTIVKTATNEDMQNIYDYGVDAFFNIENLAE